MGSGSRPCSQLLNRQIEYLTKSPYFLSFPSLELSVLPTFSPGTPTDSQPILRHSTHAQSLRSTSEFQHLVNPSEMDFIFFRIGLADLEASISKVSSWLEYSSTHIEVQQNQSHHNHLICSGLCGVVHVFVCIFDRLYLEPVQSRWVSDFPPPVKMNCCCEECGVEESCVLQSVG